MAQSRRKVDENRDSGNKLGRERDVAYAKRNKWITALVEIVVATGGLDRTKDVSVIE